jgi:HK97 family phage portal protein
MRLFGFEITRANKKALSTVSDNRGWINLIREPFTGAWQRNLEIDHNTVLSFHAVFACITLIASDIAKLRVKFMREKEGIWQEDKSPAYDPVLRKPNNYQNRIQFWENWITSKLTRGNTYVLKQKDARNVVTSLIILDPNRVKVLVSDRQEVFYELNSDNLSSLTREQRTVPATEIIHDRMNCLFHPLVGLSPLYAAALTATQGLNIQNSSTSFFGNKSVPGGVLTTPHTIKDEHLKKIRDAWESGYSGENAGRTAILSDGLEFKPLAVTATDAQLLEQAKATAEWVCSAFHVPPYKIGIGPMPTYNNIQALNVEYYSQCLQSLIEAAEECLDLGLEMGSDVGVEFDIDGLLRMDTASQVVAIKDAVGAGVMTPNEGRSKLSLMPKPGGESPYLQEQNYSLAALAKRDALENPFGAKTPPTTPAAEAEPESEDEEDDAAGDRNDEARSAYTEILTKRAQQLSRVA